MIIKSPINSKTITLDPFKEKDVNNDYVSWMKNKDITKYILKANKNLSIEDLKLFVRSLEKSQHDIFYRIVHKKDKEHIGNIRLGPINFNENYTKFGILIGNQHYHRKGIAKEAISCLKDYAFEILKLNCFKFECVVENFPAMMLYNNMGFKKKNINEKFIKDGIALDQVLWYQSV